ncbi:hypothetical protein VTN00DRAFT_2313 [Thermoascus crustaceus]|uniref:uncharacterized protein n=1 Tax=Thermoascus crustaceus TaxID=5088 RepID=UPI00374277CC
MAQQQPAPSTNPQQPPPPTLTNPRFTLELEFVLSLANPHYLSHLAVNYPNLLGTSSEKSDDSDTGTTSSPDAQAFAAYLAYLYSYWKTPEYAQFLTHPGATLRALRLLQEEAFRRDIIRPQVIEGLLGMGTEGVQSSQDTEPAAAGAEQGTDNAERQNGVKT